MKSDLDRLMAEDGLDWLLVLGPREGNGDFQYLTGGVALHGGPVVKKWGEPAAVLYNPMEVEEAEKSGLVAVSMKELRLHEISREESDPFRLLVRGRSRLFEYFGISGRVGLYGMVGATRFWHLMNELVRLHPDFEPVMPEREGVIARARRTKDAGEIETMRDAGVRTCAIFAEIFEFLSHSPVTDGLLQHEGAPLLIGQVKARLRAACAREGLDEGGMTIFAQGADGGRPHSQGNDAEPVRTRTPIVFDFFPRDLATGYCFDMTRSFCLGEASEEYLERWNLVHRAFTESMAAIRAGVSCHVPQEIACGIFEEAGHPTSRTDPSSDVGYTHSLGHGIGLDLHEPPGITLARSVRCDLEAGNVVTVEPGLYYPDDGWGLRIEDTVVVTESGIRNLTDLPIEPVVPMRAG